MSKFQGASRILGIVYALSKWPHFLHKMGHDDLNPTPLYQTKWSSKPMKLPCCILPKTNPFYNRVLVDEFFSLNFEVLEHSEFLTWFCMCAFLTHSHITHGLLYSWIGRLSLYKYLARVYVIKTFELYLFCKMPICRKKIKGYLRNFSY